MKHVAFSDLSTADLVVDAVYESRIGSNTVAAEPLALLTGTGNQGGFRFSGPTSNPNLVVLYTTMGESNWPDSIDEESGLFVYFGDNRKPGFELHDRKSGRGGNEILRRSFERAPCRRGRQGHGISFPDILSRDVRSRRRVPGLGRARRGASGPVF
jgi:hypothetical protein